MMAFRELIRSSISPDGYMAAITVGVVGIVLILLFARFSR